MLPGPRRLLNAPVGPGPGSDKAYQVVPGARARRQSRNGLTRIGRGSLTGKLSQPQSGNQNAAPLAQYRGRADSFAYPGKMRV